MLIYASTSFEDLYGSHLTMAAVRKRLVSFFIFYKQAYYERHLAEYIETGRIVRATGRSSNAN